MKNLNIRCIEIEIAHAFLHPYEEKNLNIRCIEIDIELMSNIVAEEEP